MAGKSKERIRAIPGLRGRYYVSDHGRVYSAYYGRQLVTELNHNGYERVFLKIDGKYVRKFVHRLVALAFIGDPPVGFVVNHKDSNRVNNKLENLEYVTVRENVIHGRISKNGQRGFKLTLDKVEEIRALHGKRTLSSLAKQYGVSIQMVSQVQNRKSWV